MTDKAGAATGDPPPHSSGDPAATPAGTAGEPPDETADSAEHQATGGTPDAAPESPENTDTAPDSHGAPDADDVPEGAEAQAQEETSTGVDHPSEDPDHPAPGLPYHQESPTPVNPSPDSPGTRGHRPGGASRRADPVPAGSVLVAAAATGGWAATVSFAPVLAVVLLGWFGTSAVSGGTAVRFAVTAWLLGHGVPFTAPHGQIGLVPLGITALVAWRLVRAGAHTARAVAAAPRDVPYVVGALAVAYGVIGFVAGIAADTKGFAVAPWQALLITGLVGGLASLPGALSETGAAARLWEHWSGPVREGARGGAVAALWILAAGAGLAGLATATAYQDAVDLYRGYDVGVGGGAGIALVGLLYAPNLAVWGAAYLVGPGFGFGVGTGVTVFGVSLGALPAVPVLAGLPTGPAPTAVGVLLAVPVLAGMAVGVATARRHPEWEWPALVTATALTGAVAGVILGAASFASSGSLGSGRLAEIGPRWWLVALVAAGVVAVGAVLAGGTARALTVRRPD